AMATTPESLIRRNSAMSTFEKPRPTMASTLSRSRNFCTIWAPTSGLSWSSSITTLTFWSPNLPPSCSMASMKPSRWSWPSTPCGPDSTPENPMVMSAWAAGTAMNRPATRAATVVFFIACLRLLYWSGLVDDPVFGIMPLGARLASAGPYSRSGGFFLQQVQRHVDDHVFLSAHHAATAQFD